MYLGLPQLAIRPQDGFDMLSLWLGGQPGGWWSNRGANLATASQFPTVAWQESTGVTQAVAIADPVGLWLDRRLGATALANPGLHLAQATAAARPLKQARVNLLTDSSACVTGWGGINCTAAASATLGPDGVTALQMITATSTGNRWRLSNISSISGLTYALSFYMAPGSSNFGGAIFSPAAAGVIFNLTGDGAVVSTTGIGSSATISKEGALYRCTLICVATVTAATGVLGFGVSDGSTYSSNYPSAASGTVLGGFGQLELTALSRYQRVTTATDYNTSGFPVFEQFDGADDGLASATVAAGVVGGNNQYVAALIKRMSAAKCILINGDLTTKYLFGVDPAGGATSATGSAGTPTYRVDGVDVAATEVALNTALTVGAWHVVEAIGADTSAWTQWGTDSTATYFLNGGINEIVSAPNPTAAVQAKVRRSLYALIPGMTGS